MDDLNTAIREILGDRKLNLRSDAAAVTLVREFIEVISAAVQAPEEELLHGSATPIINSVKRLLREAKYHSSIAEEDLLALHVLRLRAELMQMIKLRPGAKPAFWLGYVVAELMDDVWPQLTEKSAVYEGSKAAEFARRVCQLVDPEVTENAVIEQLKLFRDQARLSETTREDTYATWSHGDFGTKFFELQKLEARLRAKRPT